LRELTVQTPVATTTGVQLANPPLLVPVLRAGLGMVDRAHALIPEARDVTAICALAAPEGVERLAGAGLPVRLVTASIDERLNDDAFVVPGLGDAGDRQFGPR